MNQNQSGMYKNNLSSHAALLLSASPTIVTSPLNNPQQSSPSNLNLSNSNINNQQQTNKINQPVSNLAKNIARIAMSRRISNAPLVSNHNLDQVNQAPQPRSSLAEGPSSIDTINTINNEGYINFKKPQNEIFKKLDGKIQKIVAAHSNLNKLYALNDFSGMGSGPKRPFELPPQLPPPPPCIPRTISPLESGRGPEVNYSSNSIDSAISKLHQRRKSGNAQPLMQNTQLAHQRRPNVGQPGPIKQVRPVNRVPESIAPTVGPTPTKQTPTTSSGQPKPNKVDPAIMRLMAQKIKEALDNDNGPKNHQQSSSASTIAEKKKFQVDLINLLKREISVVAKSANINFTTPPRPPVQKPEQKSLLRTSPQSLFNTIHRETSLLLKQRDSIRSSLSIIPTPQQKVPQFRPLDRKGLSTFSHQQQQIHKTPSTIKLVLPPTEFLSDDINKLDASSSPSKSSTLRRPPSYHLVRAKLRVFQKRNHISLAKLPASTQLNPSTTSMKTGGLKTLDKIVDRLQAKSLSRSSSLVSSDRDDFGNLLEDDSNLSFQQRIVNTSAHLIRNSRINNTMTLAQTPIPVFRLPYGNAAKNIYYNRSNALKALSMRSKKNKKIQNLGLVLSSYLERELEQPTQDKITVDDYARGLNLVRPNDISLQRHKERLLQSETRWKLPLTNRPVRLRRLRGERIHMPASASYRAASKAGLQ